jgi:hypothetical protein
MHDSDQTDAGRLRKGYLQQRVDIRTKIDGAGCYGVIAYIFNNTVELKKKNRRMKAMS